MTLPEIIIQKIKSNGPVSFRDYMEMALYYPEKGYYTGAKEKIGIKGDFYTSSSLTPAFGAMIGRQVEQMWSALSCNPFTVVEYGAGTGYLCHDILDYLKNNKALYEQLHYCIIEKSDSMRAKQESHLNGKVSWHNSIRDISGFTGCILSNEVLDNFPVHKVVMEDELKEIYVDYKDSFVEIAMPASGSLTRYLTELGVQLTEGFRTEINMDALGWIKEIASSMKRGYVITIDYGHTSSRLYHECRGNGTLICYNNHQVNEDLYQHIGEQDITAHVNFSALKLWGEKNGLECCGFTDQANFLVSLGFPDYLMLIQDTTENIIMTARKAAYINHKLLIDMGDKFKVLIQGRDAPHRRLNGLNNLLAI